MIACNSCIKIHNLRTVSTSFVKVNVNNGARKSSCQICGARVECQEASEPSEAVPRRTFSSDDCMYPRCPYCSTVDENGLYITEMDYESVRECFDCGKEYEVEVEIETTCMTYPTDEY